MPPAIYKWGKIKAKNMWRMEFEPQVKQTTLPRILHLFCQAKPPAKPEVLPPFKDAGKPPKDLPALITTV